MKVAFEVGASDYAAHDTAGDGVSGATRIVPRPLPLVVAELASAGEGQDNREEEGRTHEKDAEAGKDRDGVEEGLTHQPSVGGGSGGAHRGHDASGCRWGKGDKRETHASRVNVA